MASGVRGRTDRMQRYRKKRLSEGFCMFCSKKISEESKSLCEYHKGYQAGRKTAEEKFKRSLNDV